MSDTAQAKPYNIKAMLENIEPRTIDVSRGTKEKGVFAVVPKGMEAISVKKFLDENHTKPEFRTGTHEADDLPTFIDITNRFKSEQSVVFAQADVTENIINAKLSTIFDFHPEGGDLDKAENLRHRVSYPFPVSKELRFWMEHNSTAMEQTGFALLLEERIGEMVAAGDDERNAIRNLKPKFADPIDMLELSRDLEIYSNETVRQAGKLSSGEKTIVFNAEHTDAAGNKLSVPDFFVISIPVFEGGEDERIIVRLRYRKKESIVLWFYDLYRIDKVFQNAFDESLNVVREKTGLPVYKGRP